MPRIGIHKLTGAGSSTEKKKLMNRFDGQLAAVARFRRIIISATSGGSSARTRTRA